MQSYGGKKCPVPWNVARVWEWVCVCVGMSVRECAWVKLTALPPQKKIFFWEKIQMPQKGEKQKAKMSVRPLQFIWPPLSLALSLSLACA